MTSPISKITNGLLDSIMTLITTKQGITIFLLVLTIFILILWWSHVIKKNGGFITLIFFMATMFMSWITWVQCG